mmetsp:Transcript_97/g.381  ORF Transcript_97/g.381 Transcript_97/m.381 type:complete len:462 (-) Transcript_97:393-1778(-)|eukprot:CAMPEP_0185542642 /NCGR_PEP_ID=MMETSP1381-20130426/2739_1 /TAXON_ID=298111 /ORGANISM="Pavlova sp., Strain CCMP459" /LENGTH=461 /DNA_ID=CAMNT_0028154659 /DNA_START=28 /DNA_END=1413 /DNA_ORIENTATION=+
MKTTFLAAGLAICAGLGGMRLHEAGIFDFARLILNEAYPSGADATHLKRGKAAFTKLTNFLPEEDLGKWIDTIHEVGFLAAGYPRRPLPSNFGEAFHTSDGSCPFLYEVDETGTLCSLFNHIDLITYQIFIGGHLGLKFSVKALMAQITQYMIKLRTPVQDAGMYNNTAINMFKPLMEDERIHDAVRKFTGMPIIEPPFPAHVSILPPGTLLHDHLDQPNFRGMDNPRVPRWLIKVMGYSGLFERWRVRDCTFLLYFTQQKDGQFFSFTEGPYEPPALFEAHANDVMMGNTGDMWHGIRMVGSWEENPYDMQGKTIKMLSNMTVNPWTLRYLPSEAQGGERLWGVFDGERLLKSYRWDEMRAAAQLRYRTFASQEEYDVYAQHTDDLTVEQVVETLVDDLVARGRLKSKEIPRDRLAKLLVSEYIRFPKTLNTSFPLNWCLVYDFMPSFVQTAMASHCMTK